MHDAISRFEAGGATHVSAREEARAWPRRNLITRAIGVFDRPELEMIHGAREPNDIVVICSDGLTNHVEDEGTLALVSHKPPQRACDLVALTLDRGASDNVTVVVVRFAPAAMASDAAGHDIWE
jgi:serine/threonine protein phosphatase PrpC